MKDLRDQAGDRLRGRSTLPIRMGVGNARRSIIVPIIFWSLFSPWFWRLGVGGYGLIVLMATVGLRVRVSSEIRCRIYMRC